MPRVKCNNPNCIHHYTGRLREPDDPKMHWEVGQCKKNVLNLAWDETFPYPYCLDQEDKEIDDAETD